MPLPKFLQPYLWSYEISQMDPKRDRRVIVEQILNLGDEQALNWLFKHYSPREIKTILRKPARGIWQVQSLNYWLNIFGLKIPKAKYKKALFNIEPQF